MNIDVYKCSLVRDTSVTYNPIRTSNDAAELLMKLGLNCAADEYFYLICLNAKGEIAGLHEVSHGDLCSSSSHPREIFKRALINNSASIIVGHNHPSGDCKPSETDVATTDRIAECGRLLGIPVIDHLIIAHDDYFSFKAEGLL